MKRILLSIASVLTLGLAAPAQADLLLEPYVGYATGDLEGASSADANGYLIGGRVGFQTLGFSVGGEYMTGEIDTDNGTSQDYTPANIGIFVGYDFPVLIRAYGTYFIQSKADFGAAEYEGDGIKLGVGFSGLPFVSVNLEYLAENWDERNGVSTDVDTKLYMLTVSLPFSL